MRSSVVILATMLAACQPGDRSRGGAIEDLKATDSAFQQALVSKDVEEIVSFYADDAVLLPTAEPMIRGKAAIREEWEHIVAIPDFTNAAQLRGAEISKSGELGYTWGTYRARMMGEDGSPVEEPGKWVTIWKRSDDGNWRVAVDTYNTDVPPPDHK